MKRVYFGGTVVAIGLLTGNCALAALSISGSVGGAPTGVNYYNFNANPPSGIVSAVSFTGDAGFVTGSSSGLFAAPFVSGGNGAVFGDANGVDASRYATTGVGTVEVSFSSLQKYIGLLWGSVDGYNSLDLYDGLTLVGSITGSNVTVSPNGDQGVNGTLYVNINSTLGFDRMVASSSSYAFEFDNLAYDDRDPNLVPEPGSLALLAGGLLFGAGFSWRARRR